MTSFHTYFSSLVSIEKMFQETTIFPCGDDQLFADMDAQEALCEVEIDEPTFVNVDSCDVEFDAPVWMEMAPAISLPTRQHAQTRVLDHTVSGQGVARAFALTCAVMAIPVALIAVPMFPLTGIVGASVCVGASFIGALAQ